MIEMTQDEISYSIALGGEIDLAVESYLHVLLQRFEARSAPNAEVDLAKVTFIDSTGLAFLVRLRNISEERGGAVTLQRPNAQIMRILRLVDFDSVFTIVGAQSDAHGPPAERLGT